MTNQMKVFALMVDVDDSYDIGTHQEVFELFTDRAIAEHAMEGLIGKPRKELRPYRDSPTWVWSKRDFEIEEMTLR